MTLGTSLPPPLLPPTPPKAALAVNRRFLAAVAGVWCSCAGAGSRPGHRGGFGNAAGSCHLHPSRFRNPAEDGALSPPWPGTPVLPRPTVGGRGFPCPLWGAETGASGVWGGGGSVSCALPQSGAQGGVEVGPGPARSQVSHSPGGTTVTGAGLSRPTVTLWGARRTRHHDSGARPAPWLFFLPRHCSSGLGRDLGLGQVGAGGPSPSHHPWGSWHGGMTRQHHPHQEMWSNPSSSSHGSPWDFARSLLQQHRVPHWWGGWALCWAAGSS